jgi:hypothetical protein
MKHEWHVTVRDPEGAAIEDAVVALHPALILDTLGLEYPYAGAPATHQHDGGGHYLASALELSEGPWFLIVQRKDKSPVVQPLAMRQNAAGELFANPPLTRLAKCVSFAAETTQARGEKVRKTSFVVTLHPASEVVLLSGTEYHSAGTRFHVFALGRRDALSREGLIDAGTLVTLISCDHRGIGTFVKAHRGFVDVRPLPEPPEGVVPGRAHASPDVDTDEQKVAKGRALRAAGALSIEDFYRYLSLVGEQRPGSVKEASIFSHCYELGPLLYNTYEVEAPPEPGEPAPPPTPEHARFALDLDGRVKDFHPVNVEGENGWPHMKAALAEDGVYRVWGCNADAEYRNTIRDAEAVKSRGEEALFIHRESEHTYRSEKRLHRKFLKGFLFRRFAAADLTYLAAAAKFFEKSVIGAPPGAGSEFAFQHGVAFMCIDQKQWGKTYPYYKEQFGPEFKPTAADFDTGYVDFSAVQKHAEPAKTEFDPALFKLIVDLKNKVTHLVLFDAVWHEQVDGTDFRLRDDAFERDGKKGLRYVLSNRDPSKERALFVTKDKAVFRLERDAKQSFTVLGERLDQAGP